MTIPDVDTAWERALLDAAVDRMVHGKFTADLPMEESTIRDDIIEFDESHTLIHNLRVGERTVPVVILHEGNGITWAEEYSSAEDAKIDWDELVEERNREMRRIAGTDERGPNFGGV